MAKDPDLSQLAAYSGKYEDALMQRFLNTLDVNNPAIDFYPGVKNKVTLTKIIVGKGAKPYTGTHKAKSDISYVPRVLQVEDCQRDLTIEPKKYRPSYMGEMRGKGEAATNKTIPFAQYVNEAIMLELASEVNNESLYFGVGVAGFAAYGAGTVYNPGDKITYTQDGELRYFECVTLTVAGQNPDTHPAKWVWAGAKALIVGFGKRITDEIAGGGLVATVTGAVNAGNAYAAFTKMWRALPLSVRSKGGVIVCSYTDYEYLLDDYEDKVSKNFETVDGITYLAKTDRKCIIAPWSAMSGSRRLIATAPKNLIVGTDELSDMNTINADPQMYSIDYGITWVLGTQFRDLEAMAISDQA